MHKAAAIPTERDFDHASDHLLALKSLARKEFSLKENSLVGCSKYIMTLLNLLHVIKRLLFKCKPGLQSICFLIFLDIKH